MLAMRIGKMNGRSRPKIDHENCCTGWGFWTVEILHCVLKRNRDINENSFKKILFWSDSTYTIHQNWNVELVAVSTGKCKGVLIQMSYCVNVTVLFLLFTGLFRVSLSNRTYLATILVRLQMKYYLNKIFNRTCLQHIIGPLLVVSVQEKSTSTSAFFQQGYFRLRCDYWGGFIVWPR